MGADLNFRQKEKLAGLALAAAFAIAACSSSPAQQNQVVRSPSPSAIVVAGHGDDTGRDLQLVAGNYRVTWTITGSGVLGVFLLGLSGTLDDPNAGLIIESRQNEVAGEVRLKGIVGGKYLLQVTAGTMAWRLTFTRI